MRIITLCFCGVVLLGCVRPSSGIGLADLTEAAGKDLAEFNEWVSQDKEVFPNGLCLSSVEFEVKITNSETTGANVSIPLAAPTAGITTVLGYDLTITELSDDVVKLPFIARYTRDPGESGASEVLEFLSKKPEIEGRPMVRTPPGEIRSLFLQRRDLASELWRIREAAHRFFLRTAREDMLLLPKKLDFERSYTVTIDQKRNAAITIVGGPEIGLSRNSKVTDINQLKVYYVQNTSSDMMTCNRESIASSE